VKELHAPEWIPQVTGRLKATGKDELRKALGRSPDRADAVALAVWEPMASAPGYPRHDDYEAAPAADVFDDVHGEHTFNPYGGAS
jgi:hypothetical protein